MENSNTGNYEICKYCYRHVICFIDFDLKCEKVYEIGKSKIVDSVFTLNSKIKQININKYRKSRIEKNENAEFKIQTQQQSYSNLNRTSYHTEIRNNFINHNNQQNQIREDHNENQINYSSSNNKILINNVFNSNILSDINNIPKKKTSNGSMLDLNSNNNQNEKILRKSSSNVSIDFYDYKYKQSKLGSMNTSINLIDKRKDSNCSVIKYNKSKFINNKLEEYSIFSPQNKIHIPEFDVKKLNSNNNLNNHLDSIVNKCVLKNSKIIKIEKTGERSKSLIIKECVLNLNNQEMNLISKNRECGKAHSSLNVNQSIIKINNLSNSTLRSNRSNNIENKYQIQSNLLNFSRYSQDDDNVFSLNIERQNHDFNNYDSSTKAINKNDYLLSEEKKNPLFTKIDSSLKNNKSQIVKKIENPFEPENLTLDTCCPICLIDKCDAVIPCPSKPLHKMHKYCLSDFLYRNTLCKCPNCNISLY